MWLGKVKAIVLRYEEHVNHCYEQYSKDENVRGRKKSQLTNVRSSLFDPGDVETASYKGIGVSHFLDDLSSGLARAVTGLCVHKDEQRVLLLGAAAHNVLKGGNVLEGVQRHHPVIVVPRQQEHRGVLDPVPFGDTDVVERGVPVEEQQREGTEFRHE